MTMLIYLCVQGCFNVASIKSILDQIIINYVILGSWSLFESIELFLEYVNFLFMTSSFITWRLLHIDFLFQNYIKECFFDIHIIHFPLVLNCVAKTALTISHLTTRAKFSPTSILGCCEKPFVTSLALNLSISPFLIQLFLIHPFHTNEIFIFR